MKTTVLTAGSIEAEAKEAIAKAATVLRAGGLVAFPTETVYGLGANALDAEAIRRIFAAKGRPANNPLIVHIARVQDVFPLVAPWTEDAARLAAAFWPGPLTLVLPRSPIVPDVVTAGGATVAVRCPAHTIAQALITSAGVPVAAPSANRSGQLSPVTAAHVLADLDGAIDIILDGGIAGGIESVVVDVSRRPARLLRPGLITPAQIEAVLGATLLRPELTAGTTETVLASPGLLERHYAPRTPLELVEAVTAAQLAVWSSQDVWLVTHLPEEIADSKLQVVTMPGDATAYAAALYGVLHEIDARGARHILVRTPPAGEEWLGVRDRLRRAAAK